MKIPVLAFLPTQTSLVESALESSNPATPGLSDGVETPNGFEADTSFPPIPIGSGDPALETFESLNPTASQNFAVRGTIEAESIADVPHQIEGRLLFADPQIEPFITCGETPALGDHNDVAHQLDLATLHNAGLDGDQVAVAILDTGINLQHLVSKLGRTPRIDPLNSWTPPGVQTNPFQYPVGHGTMCAYDALIAAPNATLLDFPILQGQAPGGAVSGRVLSTALLAFSQLLAFWAVAYAPGGAGKFKALVVNNSWGLYHPSWDFVQGHPGRYIDNPNHPFNIVVKTLANTNADLLFAAGNCGTDCPSRKCQGKVTETISGANALSEVLTLAGCDVNDQRVGYSSQGPGIAGMAQEKPDLTAYTHFLGSEASGAGVPDTGTSTSCPVTAGVVAAMRTSAQATPASVPSVSMFATLRATARQVQGAPGWNADYGHGILNPLAVAQALGLVDDGAAGA